MADSGDSSTESVGSCQSSLTFKKPRLGDESEEEGPRFYSGYALVQKVYEDLKARNEKTVNLAWTSFQNQAKEEIASYVQWKSKENATQGQNGHMPYEPMPFPVCGKKEKIKMPAVEALPHMIYWTETPVNIPTIDSKYLSHIPFMGDDFDKRDQETNFSEQLLEMYDEKVLSEEEQWADVLPDNFDLLEFIRILMKIKNEYGDAIFSAESSPVKKLIKQPTLDDLLRTYEHVRNAGDKDFVMNQPSTKLIEAVCKTVVPTMGPEKLLKQYKLLAQRRNPNAKAAPKNVDAPSADGGVHSKVAQMDSYRNLFCRLCYQYACVRHGLLTNDELLAMQAGVKLQRKEAAKQALKKSSKKKERQDATIQCKFPNCCKKDVSKEASPLSREDTRLKRENILLQWTPVERTMFNCHYDSLKDYCIVASLLNSKTCKEVMDYHQLCAAEITEIISATKSVKLQPGPSNSNESVADSSNDSSSDDDEGDPDGNLLWDICSFQPCVHENGVCDETCLCLQKGRPCESSCGCLKSCPHRFKGCVCTTTCNSGRCPCYVANRECDPDLCKRCGSHELDLNKMTCKNVYIQRRIAKPMYVKKSRVNGLGAFAAVPIKKGEFIDEYTAEVISVNEAERRGHVYDERMHTYLMELTKNSNLDASRIGNSTRFMNSSRHPNCEPIKMNIRGEIRMSIRARKNIAKDEELFFDYHDVLNQKKAKDKTKKQKYAKK